VLRKFLCLLAVLFSFFAIAAPVHASDQTVFGPKVLKINRWHFHFSFHRFRADNAEDGIITITKNTNKKIRGGLLVLNRRFIPIRKFLRGSDMVFEKEVTLRSRNRLMVFLWGKPRASITIEIKEKSTTPPPEITFAADPQSITLGESSTLSWATTHADSVNIDQGIGSVDLNGSVAVSPQETTTYTLTAEGPGGTTTENVIVTVIPPAPTVNISADPATILVGETSSLAWSTTYADSCTIEPDIGSVDVNGSIQVSPTETTTYTITATNAGGTTTANVAVTVLFPPTVTISADPTTLMPGESSTLSWSSTNAESASIDQGIGPVSVNGTTTVSPTETTTYTITATGPGGSAADSVEVVVITPPPDVDYGLDTDEQQGGGGLVGETVRVLNGNTVEFRPETGFPSPHSLNLALAATYNSRSDQSSTLGFGWTHTYNASLDPSVLIHGTAFLKITDSTGRAHYFTEETAGEYVGVFAERTHVKTEAGGYVWYLLDGTQYGFSTAGQLLWIDDEKGNRLTLAYDAQNRVASVTDTAGNRVLTFNYNANSLLESITGPVTPVVSSGIWATYGYDANQNLTSVTYADGSGIIYNYTDPEDIHNLTEKKNKAGHLINTWTYDTQDRCVDNFSKDGKGVSISYQNEFQVNVTDAYGKLREYLLDDVAGRMRVSSVINGPGGAGGFPYTANNAVSWTYDESMRLGTIEYAGGTVVMYLLYDEKGNPGAIKFAYNTPDERQVTYTYHPDMNVLLTRTEAGVLSSGDKVTIWDYDNDYNTTPNENPTALLARVIEKGFTKDISGAVVPYEYTTILTYNSKGQVLSIDGPLPGNGDTTSFTYDSITGDLLSIIRPLIGSLGLSSYDAAGQVGQITDVNGQSKSFTYDSRGRITAITHQDDGSTSNIAYNTAGLVDSRTDEDSVTTSFEYDAVYGRFARTTDNEGNYIAYAYDVQGNVIEKSYYDPADTRSNQKRYTYQDPAHTMPGKLFKQINPDDTFTQYGYDLEANIASILDPKGNTTTYDYDPFNRLKTVTQPGSVVTSYDYDTHGNLISVTDAQSHVTTYEYDDMGRVVTTTSPDTGTTAYVYDQAGNLTNKADAKGITVGYTYDLLNRLTNVGFPDSLQNITYTYDAGTDGMGRRTGMTDPSGSTTFGYSSRGRLIEKTAVVNGYNYALTQAFTPGGRINSITYPSGRTIDYERSMSCACNVEGVSTTFNGNTVTLMSNLSYRPFGIASGMDTGSGGTVNNIFDEAGRLTVANPGSSNERTYTYDAIGNLTSISAPATPWHNRTYGYDVLKRLEHAEGPYGIIDYTYDGVGNRLTKVVNSQTENYTYATGTNRLEEVTGPVAYTYDANGNITGIANKVLTYNQNNRLVRVQENGGILGEYTYNGLGQRVIKTAGGVTTVFHYDFNGNIIAESDMNGNFTYEHLYKHKSRIALVDVNTGEMFYFLNDSLGTPQMLTDSTNTVVWEGVYKPFGEAEVNPNSSVACNFRFPGQYYDQETGLHYNYFRYYDPAIGRYLTPDPIGLAGMDPNLYGYVQNNPINLIDPLGLYLSPSQKAKVSIASGIGSALGYAVGTLAGAPNLGSAFGGLLASAIAAKSMEGSTWQDVAKSAISGGLSGLTGASIGSLLRGTLMNNIRVATVTGVISGVFDAMLLGADPIFKEPDTKNTPCN